MNWPQRRFWRRRWPMTTLAIALVFGIPFKAHAVCSSRIAVQVLGSGGPDSNDARASSGYLVWVDGQARLLVDVGGARDQNGDNAAFAAMVKGADILVMDHAIPETADPVSRQLRARPSEIGLLAAKAGVGRLVLSHNMARCLGPLKENLVLIRQHYAGRTTVAKDLMCID